MSCLSFTQVDATGRERASLSSDPDADIAHEVTTSGHLRDVRRFIDCSAHGTARLVERVFFLMVEWVLLPQTGNTSGEIEQRFQQSIGVVSEAIKAPFFGFHRASKSATRESPKPWAY